MAWENVNANASKIILHTGYMDIQVYNARATFGMCTHFFPALALLPNKQSCTE